MIGVLMTFPKAPEDKGLFQKFVRATPGVVHSYLLENSDGQATFTVWESVAAREAYLKTQLRSEIDASVPGFNRTVFEVKDRK